MASTYEATEEMMDLVQTIKEARKAKSGWKKVEDDARVKLFILIDNATAVDTDGSTEEFRIKAGGVPIASTTISGREGVNRKKLQAMYPYVYADVLESKDVTTLNIDI